MNLELRATPEEVMRGVETLQEFARAQGVGEKVIFGLALALEECASNIVNHGLKRDASRIFKVMFEHCAGEFLIELQDDGPPFDPTATDTRPAQAADDDVPGGWGIQLVRRQMDEIHYRREDGTNILRLTKRLAPGTDAD